MTADVKSVVWSHIVTPPIRLLACIGKLSLYFAVLQTTYCYSWTGKNAVLSKCQRKHKHRKELYGQKISFFFF